MWTDESKYYDPTNPVASHFNQVVWKIFTSVACAMAHCEVSIFEPLFWVCTFLYRTGGAFTHTYRPCSLLHSSSANIDWKQVRITPLISKAQHCRPRAASFFYFDHRRVPRKLIHGQFRMHVDISLLMQCHYRGLRG